MHESTVCREILMIAQRAAFSNDIACITDITLAIGEKTCIQPEQLQFCFSIAKQGTIAEQAILHIIHDETITGDRQEFVRQIKGEEA